jgi:hypothetical protein
MANDNQRTLHEYALGVSAFLGGISFTTMTLVMTSKDKFEYTNLVKTFNLKIFPELIIVGLAVVSIFFIVSTIGMIPVATGRIHEQTMFADFAYKAMLVGFYGLCVLFTLLLLPFSLYGAIAIVIISTISIILYTILYDRQ